MGKSWEPWHSDSRDNAVLCTPLEENAGCEESLYLKNFMEKDWSISKHNVLRQGYMYRTIEPGDVQVCIDQLIALIGHPYAQKIDQNENASSRWTRVQCQNIWVLGTEKIGMQCSFREPKEQFGASSLCSIIRIGMRNQCKQDCTTSFKW